MDKSRSMWLPIIASVGVGAATYYTISKNNQTISQTLEKIMPVVSQMTSGENLESEQSQGSEDMGMN